MNPQDCVQAPGPLFNLAAHLLNCNAARPNKVAFADDSGTFTNYQLSERVRKLAAGLPAHELYWTNRVARRYSCLSSSRTITGRHSRIPLVVANCQTKRAAEIRDRAPIC